MFENVSQHIERWQERDQVFENASQHIERWRERNPVFENTSQHNEQRHEKMAQEGRKKTINDVVDVVNLGCDNVRPYGERQQGSKQVFENAREDNEQGGLLIWHASMLMAIIFFISLADYGMNPAFMVVGTYTYHHRQPV